MLKIDAFIRSVFFCFFLWGHSFVSVLSPGPVFAQTSQERACTQCVQGSTQSCTVKCGHFNKDPECVPKCLTKGCGFMCTKPRSTPPPPSREAIEARAAPCSTCVRKKEQNECLAECKKIGYGSSPKCRSSCARKRCADVCPLPDSDAKEPPKVIGMDCYTCKNTSENKCQSGCGSKDDPGYVACVVGCVEDRCQQNCHPERYE